MADSVVHGPESVISIWIAWRSGISPAISDQSAALDGSEIDGPERRMAQKRWTTMARDSRNRRAKNLLAQSFEPESRVEGRALDSSILRSSNGAGAACSACGPLIRVKARR